MVFQKDTLLPGRRSTPTSGSSTRSTRAVAPKADEIVSELLELAGLTAFKDAYPYRLSGGMRRRAAFISALAAQPRLLLLDEPFSSLDEPTRVAIHQDVFDILKRLRTTVVLVTHDLAEAASLCDEIVILTHRPASIATRHDVPFGAERVMMKLREQAEFLRALRSACGTT